MPIRPKAPAASPSGNSGDIDSVSPAVEKYATGTIEVDLWKRQGLTPRDRRIATVATPNIDVLHRHGGGGRDPSKGVGHQSDQGPVAESDRDGDINAVQELACVLAVENRRLPCLTICFGLRTALAGLKAERRRSPASRTSFG
jgi:hypothetical protein